MLGGHGLREREHRALRRTVDGALDETDGGHDRAGVDDRAPTGRAHVRHDGPAHVGHTEHVHVEHALPVLGRGGDHVAHGTRAGVVAEHVDVTVAFDDRARRGVARVRVAHVEAVDQVEAHHGGPVGGEAPRDRRADPARGAGHHHHVRCHRLSPLRDVPAGRHDGGCEHGCLTCRTMFEMLNTGATR